MNNIFIDRDQIITINNDIIINIKENSNVKLILVNNTKELNITINLNKNSTLKLEKFNIDAIENITINLEENSKIDYILKTISLDYSKYTYIINHNGINSVSNITNNGVNKIDKLIFDVSCYIKKGITNCTANQNNRIINLTNELCIINPNLYIDEYDVNASHSALIGNFSYDEIFYLLSKGISYDYAIKLLTKGFLLNKIENEDIIKQINNYL